MQKKGKKPVSASLDAVRHSLAHLLAAVVLKKFPTAKLGVGPTIENGFYYDFLLPRPIANEELGQLEEEMRKLIRQNLRFRGRKVSAAEAKKLMRGQPFKLELIRDFTKEKRQLSVYDIATPDGGKVLFLDLCRGGHVHSTQEIHPDAFRLTKTAGAYWKGSERNPQLQRIYGVAFATKRELTAYLKLQEELEKRDHRKLGARLDLFSFHSVAPGAPFWHGNGMILFKELEAFIRSELDKAGYQEIATPIVVKKEVFETSGHWSHFREDMFFWEQDGETYVLKPMNCPESTFVYRAHTRSYKDLPLRFAEIGRIHRNELSGTLAGLFRVRQITQDDAHIYCRPDQIQSEILALLKLVKKIYRLFGFRPSFYLATKPDKALGEPKLWKKAERALKLALDESKLSYDIKPKDGAFYGPKIDVHIKDALGRDWQLATIQLDLVMLPERFQLSYVDEKGKLQKPVVIHRAIFGSFERFIGILIEHFAGSFPLWLAPVQAEVINVGAGQRNYAAQVTKLLTQASIRARLSGEHLTVGKRIREAELQKVPYILVVGEKEKKNRTANVRHHRKGQLGEQSISSLIAHLQEEIAKKAR